ncbi:MAG: imidazoleglycerol-phosphate dehydratase [Methanolobus sp.]|jgi:imidazoleglycerol-phosphate dehydratase|uniref:imidazoleglycerol-phosphate dehydratase HisB n=1 Tax=unclassified Methanolobus TaxID=2629569 RepID=UPI0024AC4C7C|nr:imidazoleglycerol-phosphate dehydratase HisB [Methanolobus sp.]MDI3485759.1 imidazoleglycerol-phosphate dehydratase [Methanolobus sp.]MDK2832712.1 imidazoleglycerol-phosphate dehydratase [Methanolobus sp.]MDK2937984.1 imidazoleglycerol-phosphate dehydratase [Methanolobus sp.]
MRKAEISRKTSETDISIGIELDGKGVADISTGVGFFDHMLTAFTKHGNFDLTVKATGDLIVDDHHLIEDTGIVLGQVLAEALGNKAGIARFGEARIPMDEALATVALDLGGRSYLVIDADFKAPKVGEFSTQMVDHFFEAVAQNAKINMHAHVYGDNDHHKIEALFKAFAYALRRAVVVEGDEIKSTKGVL